MVVFLLHCLVRFADAFHSVQWAKSLSLTLSRRSHAVTPSNVRVRLGHRMCVKEDRTKEIKQLFKPIFSIYDADRDGFLDKFELLKVDPNLEVSEAVLQLREFDLDKDGKLNLEEAMFTSLRSYFLSSDWYNFKVIFVVEPFGLSGCDILMVQYLCSLSTSPSPHDPAEHTLPHPLLRCCPTSPPRRPPAPYGPP